MFIVLLQVLSLAYAPAPHIPVLFSSLQAQAGGSQLEQLMAYIDINWITHTTWPILAWCSYNKPLRTFNQGRYCYILKLRATF